MPTVIHLPRNTVRDWSTYIDPSTTIWIAIGEPDNGIMSYDAVRNSFLDDLPNLHINFWDLVVPIPMIGDHEDGENWLYPPTETDVKTLVDFILSHKGKNVIVNCKAGYSRSAAVAQFCNDSLRYEWVNKLTQKNKPNTKLLELMTNYYDSLT